MEEYECLKCKHKWYGRNPNKNPLYCPFCHSNKWNFEGYLICKICRKHYLEITIHHINGDRKDNDRKNIIHICRYCHSYIHNKSSKEDGEKRSTYKERDFKINPNTKEKLEKYRSLWFKNKYGDKNESKMRKM